MPQELLCQFTALTAAAYDQVVPDDIVPKMFCRYAMEPPDKAFQDVMISVDPLDARVLPFLPGDTASGIHLYQVQPLLLCQGQICLLPVRTEDCARGDDLIKGGLYTFGTYFSQFYRLCIGDAPVTYCTGDAYLLRGKTFCMDIIPPVYARAWAL